MDTNRRRDMPDFETLDTGVAARIGRYSDAVRIPGNRDQIIVSGTPGISEDGALPPDFADEAP
jgi:2-iminobutanoate/2-iminopropanoate deaminase